jgi:hypothetical protein
MSRRFFVALLVALALAAAVAWAGPPPPLFCGVISDTQRPADDPLPELAWAIDQLNALAPDLVLWPGDLTNGGTDAEYENVLRQGRRLSVPMHCVPGNHEAPPGEAVYRARFTAHTGQPPWQHVRAGGWHLFMLDSVRFEAGKLAHDGAIGPEELTWLRGELAGIAPDEPLLLVAHHPFVIPGDGLSNGREVMDLAAGHYLACTLAGHFHANRHDEDAAGVHHFVTGSLSFSGQPDGRGLGYRLLSAVGRDLWTAWIETGSAAPLAPWGEAVGPAAPVRRLHASLPPPAAGTGAVAVRVRYAGPGAALRCGHQTLWRLPDSPRMATALVILPPAAAAALSGAYAQGLTLQAVRPVRVESLAVCRTDGPWEHYRLRSPQTGARP